MTNKKNRYRSQYETDFEVIFYNIIILSGVPCTKYIEYILTGGIMLQLKELFLYKPRGKESTEVSI